MSEYVQFDPKIHKKGVQLLEIQTTVENDGVSVRLVPTNQSYETAAEVPHYFFVEED